MPKIPMRRSDLVDQRPSRVDGVSRGVLLPAEALSPRADWHPTAKRLMKSFRESGQVSFWQASDWALAYSICEDLSAFKRQEDAARKSRAVRDSWEKEAGHLTVAERKAQGFSPAAPSLVPYASPQKMQVIYSMMGDLLVTEADRRRAHIELEAPAKEAQPASVAQMDAYRRGLASA